MANGEITKNDIPLFYADTSSNILFPNSIYFSDLTSSQVIHDQALTEIGEIKPACITEGLAYIDVAILLMKLGIIETFMHLHSDIELVSYKERVIKIYRKLQSGSPLLYEWIATIRNIASVYV